MKNSSNLFTRKHKVSLPNLNQNKSSSSKNCRIQKIFQKNKLPSIETFTSIAKNLPKTPDSGATFALLNLPFTTLN
jgi:translation initiation factor 2 beta subunit (eIF-2beta)/eIF-5